MTCFYNSLRELVNITRSPWRLKQFLGIKYKNNDFVLDKNMYLNDQLRNCPVPEAYQSYVCWNNLMKFALSLKIKNTEKINNYFTPSKQKGAGDKPYSHDEYFHNMHDPRIIIDTLYPVIKPRSIVDVGCGLGTFIKAFKEKGVSRTLGIDGNWVPLDKLFKYIEPDDFLMKGLQQEFLINERFDLAISLEVAEHLNEDSAEGFIKSLTKLSDIIIFSAATP